MANTHFLSDGNKYVCAISHRYEIFANQEKFQNFYLENEGQVKQVEKLDLSNSTRNVRFHIGDFFQNLSTWEHRFMQKLTHKQGDDQSKVDLPEYRISKTVYNWIQYFVMNDIQNAVNEVLCYFNI